MIEHAGQLNPGIEFRQGDLRSLHVESRSAAGVVAFYSIIHIPPDDLVGVLLEQDRILKPQGLLLLAFHTGSGSIHRDEWWGHQVSIDFYLFDSAEVEAKLEEAGFRIVEAVERDPYPDVEYPSRRAYLMAETLAADTGPD
jgi:SAM-dependent methyltransferase